MRRTPMPLTRTRTRTIGRGCAGVAWGGLARALRGRRGRRCDEHKLSIEELAAKHATHLNAAQPSQSLGLTSAEAAERLIKFGKNQARCYCTRSIAQSRRHADACCSVGRAAERSHRRFWSGGEWPES